MNISISKRTGVRTALAVLTALVCYAHVAVAQGVTTASISGTVKGDDKLGIPGAKIIAKHEPSGTTYEALTMIDGHFVIQAMRVGGPYSISASSNGFATSQKVDIELQLGVTQSIDFTLKPAAVSETVTVHVHSDPVFGASRTGAATAVTREELGVLPTISGRLTDISRLTPQYGGGGSFAGTDARLNNMTIDGSYFNDSFGLHNSPGDTTGVAPIPLEAIEQVQVNVAPFDVRQGNFIGAGVNTVTRSGTNDWTGSAYYRERNQSYVGKTAKGLSFNPGIFNTTDTGEWLGGALIRNKLFVFQSFENQKDVRPLTTFTSNPGGAPATGNTTRVLASDLTTLSQFLQTNFNYATGPFDNISKNTPGKPFLLKGDYNMNGSNRLTFRYNQLNSSSDQNLSSSSSLGNGRQTFGSNFLNFQGSDYANIEYIKSGVGEWNLVKGNSFANDLIIGYTHQDESRRQIPAGNLFPFVDILDGSGVTYTSFGSEPFTPFNQLRFNTFQVQDSFTRYFKWHTVTFGGSVEHYNSTNVFFSGAQSVYVYNTLQDFYTDANDFLANPARTTSPVTLKEFQLRYMNIPGLTQPVQPLAVFYSGAYAQDEWRPLGRLTVSAGMRVDVASFGNTGYDNPAVDQLTFRDAAGNNVQYNSGQLPKASPLYSPRIGFNWDLAGDQKTQVRGGTGVFTGPPPFVWISNQVGNTGLLTGFIQNTNTKAFPFNPNIATYAPTNITGAPATSVDLAVAAANFKFAQTWRSNIGVDRRLPWGMILTGEYIYGRDVNGFSYINANLPAAQSAFTGPDSRPRWVGTSCSNPTPGACVTRINNASGNVITENIVLGNESVGHSWDAAVSLSKLLSHGLAFKTAYHYGVAMDTVDPGSVAAGSWTGNGIVNDPNNPPLAYSANSPGKRFFLTVSYTKQYFGFGQTTVAAFFDAHTNGNTSYVFSGDMNGDGATSNDLIYIPKDTSEMNFQQFTVTNGPTFTVAQQTAAFEAYIEQDKYLSAHRGQYAQRNALFVPMVKRLDLSVMQDLFHKIGGRNQSAQIRLDITNFGNLLNSNWGVGQSIIQNRILSPQGADAQGRPLYRLATVGTGAAAALVNKTFQTTAGISDVYVIMLSFRYTFN